MRISRILSSWVLTLVASAAANAGLPPYRVEPVADVEPTGEPWYDEDCPILCDFSYGPKIQRMKAFGGQVAFSAFNHDLGKELWVTDGTEGGTHLVADLCPGACYSRPVTGGELAGEIVFSTTRTGDTNRLWASGGSSVRQIAEIGLSDLASTVELDGRLYFGWGSQVWATDGSIAELVSDFPGNGWVQQVFQLGDRAFASRWGSSGEPSDFRQFLPTSQEIHRVCDSTLTHFWNRYAVLGEVALFGADCIAGLPDLGPGIFRTDGTVGGTERVKTVPEGVPDGMLVAGGSVYFVRSISHPGERRLWRSDGTTDGTSPLTDFLPGLRYPMQLLQNRYLLLRFDSGTQVRSLDLSSGTMTELFGSSAWVVSALAFPSAELAVVNVHDSLWLTDGTREGSVRVFEGQVGETLLFGDNQVLFAGESGIHGEDLWKLQILSPVLEVPALSAVGYLLFIASLAVAALHLLGRVARRRTSGRA